MISTELLDTIINYLATKPYREVFTMINNVQREVTEASAEKVEAKDKEEK